GTGEACLSEGSIAADAQGLGPVLVRREAQAQPASLRWLRYALGPTDRGRTCNHRYRAEGIESDPQHEHLRSRRFVRSNHCGHERGYARNTDETWSRTLDWLVRDRLLAPGYGLQ